MKFRKLFLLLIIATSFKSIGQSCYEVVGYYPSWQWYDRNKLVNPQTIDYSKYTILNYAFLKPEVDGSISLFDSWADENLLLGQNDWVNGGYVPNTSLISNAHMNGVKVLPSIGGWTLSNNFPGIAADPTKRATFAQACVDLIQTYGFDGIDLDWEYPAISGFPNHRFTPEDKPNFTELIKSLREQLGKKATITFAAGGFKKFAEQAVNWSDVMPLINYVNLMTYDLVGGYSTVTGHHTPLYSTSKQKESADNCIQYLLSIGVPAKKLIMGAAFYARTWEGVIEENNGLYQKGKFKSFIGFKDFPARISEKDGFVFYWDADAQAPYAYNAKEKVYATFDDKQSIEAKTKYVIKNKLGGIMFWQLGDDNAKNGLLETINTTLHKK